MVEKRKLGWLAALAFCAFGLGECGGVPVGEGTNAIVGTWAWFNTPTVYIDAGGNLRVPGLATAGSWAPVAARTYQLDWDNGFVDRLTLSPDGNELSGYNQVGTLVTATRLP